YASSAEFLTSGAVVDSIDGGSGTSDRVVISGDIAIASGSSLARATTTERLESADDAAVRTHSIVINSNTNLSGFTTIDLSGSSNTSSTSTVTLTGVTNAVTVLGTAGVDNITGGSGADHIDGGSGDDTIVGGAGADTLIGGTGSDRITYSNGT